MALVWTAELDTGIELIDQQHRKIVDYINQLEEVDRSGDRAGVGKVLHELLDYTISHFAFEENLQEEAGYRFAKPHRKVHELFTRRAKEYVANFEAGQDVTEEVHGMLSAWLVNHIKRDDADYVGAVKENMQHIIKEKERKGRGWLSRFFR
ncbi:bacteriohemerythrin [Stutzerimonas tarimensis]|uniref:Bacteriohemerythrin n=1 Tax=Stutzerimonas tarimensis TaxID=1507735 RepID=A0ABV7T7G3_9GAMM